MCLFAQGEFPGGGGGGYWPVRFGEYVPLASQSPYLIILYSVANYKPHLSPFWQIGNFRDPNLATFYFYELTHFLSWMKNTLLFIYSTNILVILFTVIMKNCLTPQNPEMCDPILVTLLKMRPHYSQSSRENVTPSSGSSPLVSYKEVPPIPRKGKFLHKSDKGSFSSRLWVKIAVFGRFFSQDRKPIYSWTSIRPPFYSGQFLAEIPYIDTCLDLSTTATFFCRQGVSFTYLPR